MSRLYLRSPLPPFHTADSAAQNTFTTLKDVSNTDIIPAAAVMLEPGMEIEINAYGEYSTTGTPTLQMGLYWGGAAGAALAASGAVATATGAAAWSWQLMYRGQIRSVGASGSIKGCGWQKLASSLTVAAINPIPITAAARTVTIDTTPGGAKFISVGAAWGASSASNSITVYNLSVDITN